MNNVRKSLVNARLKKETSLALSAMKVSNVLAEILERKISMLQPVIKSGMTVCDRFIDEVASTTGLLSYRHFPSQSYKILQAVLLELGPKNGRVFLAMLILFGMKRAIEDRHLATLPVRVRANQIKHFEWLATQLTGTETWLELDNDIFQKEFGASTLRLYVCGSQLVEYRSGLPRSLIHKDGMGRFLSNAAYFARIGGFKPFFQIHMHVHLRDQFNEDGRNECYQCCSELYSVHPGVLGMFGGSWFYDPSVRECSPRLRYLQDVPLAGGARLFRWGPSEDCRHDALLTSPTRRNLADEGLYEPCSYFLVWDRASQLRWAAG